jgi:putative ABC transport system substrate-binding protein
LLLALGISAQAQQPPKVAKVGWLGLRPGGGSQETIRRLLSEMGYLAGKNIAFEYRNADNKLDRLPGLADELVGLKVDVLLAPGGNEALALKKATTTIPIVFFSAIDPVVAGLVDSLARPGANITGFTTIASVLSGKRLELLKETVPKLTRVALLWDPKEPVSTQQWKESQLPARELGLQLHSMEVSSADKYESAFKVALQERSSAVAVTSNALANSNQKRIADLAKKNRLPAISHRREFVDYGGLFSYGPGDAERFSRAAVMVDKILKGTKPADIPVEQPTKFELVINFKTAKASRPNHPADRAHAGAESNQIRCQPPGGEPTTGGFSILDTRGVPSL